MGGTISRFSNEKARSETCKIAPAQGFPVVPCYLARNFLIPIPNPEVLWENVHGGRRKPCAPIIVLRQGFHRTARQKQLMNFTGSPERMVKRLERTSFLQLHNMTWKRRKIEKMPSYQPHQKSAGSKSAACPVCITLRYTNMLERGLLSNIFCNARWPLR